MPILVIAVVAFIIFLVLMALVISAVFSEQMKTKREIGLSDEAALEAAPPRKNSTYHRPS
jgi:hypothetical protein